MDNKVRTLVIEDGLVDCPREGYKISFTSCRECLNMRMHRSSTSNTETSESDGIIVCDYVEIE